MAPSSLPFQIPPLAGHLTRNHRFYPKKNKKPSFPFLCGISASPPSSLLLSTMHRQRSILSFFQKPSPDNRGSSDAGFKPPTGPSRQHSAPAGDAGHAPSGSKPQRSLDAIGTDTPPEKAPRRVFSTTDLTPPSDGKTPSLFSSIMHKFVRDDDRAQRSQRYNFSFFSTLSLLGEFLGLFFFFPDCRFPYSLTFNSFNEVVLFWRFKMKTLVVLFISVN